MRRTEGSSARQQASSWGGVARCGRADLCEHLLARCAYERDDYDAYPLADGYLGYRAQVRAKVACLVAADDSSGCFEPPSTRNGSCDALAVGRPSR